MNPYATTNVEIAPSTAIDFSKRFRVIWSTSSAAMVIGSHDTYDDARDTARSQADRRPDCRVYVTDLETGQSVLVLPTLQLGRCA